MPLPKIDQPLFELTVPSNKDKIKFRPFTVKEEKILLIAQESKEMQQAILAIKQILTNCIQDYDIDKLAVFDLEYILMQIRAKAINDLLKFKVTDPETDESVELELNVNDIEIIRDESHNNKISISDDILIVMGYPTIDFLVELQSNEENKRDEGAALFDLMRICIQSVVEGDNVYKLKDFTEKEVNDFIDSLNSTVLSQVKQFFDTIPKMKYEKKYVTKDGKEKTFVAEGTETFFI